MFGILEIAIISKTQNLFGIIFVYVYGVLLIIFSCRPIMRKEDVYMIVLIIMSSLPASGHGNSCGCLHQQTHCDRCLHGHCKHGIGLIEDKVI